MGTPGENTQPGDVRSWDPQDTSPNIKHLSSSFPANIPLVGGIRKRIRSSEKSEKSSAGIVVAD